MNNNLHTLEFRTDLALECHECYENKDIDGVVVENCFYENKEITKTTVKIENEYGEKMLGKEIGTYVTLESSKLKNGDVYIHDKVIELFTETIRDMCNFEKTKSILIVGLGNLYVTPDSLGHKVVQKLLITRHFYDSLKKDMKGIRKVSAIAPGVMGQTGIETSNIVKSIAHEINADLVIVLDALCARNVERLNQTIQISDTGISPGAGVNNNRATINKKFIGCRVVAIGVPTVIDAKMLFSNALQEIFNEEDSALSKYSLSNNEKGDIIDELLNNSNLDMFVSPKEIDEVIVRLSGIIARSLNLAIHEGISTDEITSLLY